MSSLISSRKLSFNLFSNLVDYVFYHNYQQINCQVEWDIFFHLWQKYLFLTFSSLTCRQEQYKNNHYLIAKLSLHNTFHARRVLCVLYQLHVGIRIALAVNSQRRKRKSGRIFSNARNKTRNNVKERNEHSNLPVVVSGVFFIHSSGAFLLWYAFYYSAKNIPCPAVMRLYSVMCNTYIHVPFMLWNHTTKHLFNCPFLDSQRGVISNHLSLKDLFFCTRVLLYYIKIARIIQCYFTRICILYASPHALS